jgi:MFS family permease
MSPTASLWRHHDFRTLWFAQTLAALSANVTHLALPLIAVVALHASPFEMGLLSAMATLPNLLLGLFAGPWVDRALRRPLLIAADGARALLLVSIPISFAFNLLTMGQLYVVLFLFGIGTTVFEVANASYLPGLVGRDQVLSANSRIVASTSVAGAVGPGLAGALVQLLSAPLAILVDSTALVISAALLSTIRSREARPLPPSHHSSLWSELAAGLRPLWQDPLLRSITGSSMIYLFFNNIMVAVYVVYAVRELLIAPGVLGVIYGLGGAGAVFGALLATQAARRLGLGRSLIITNLVGGLFLLLVPAARAAPSAALWVLGLAQCASQMMGAVFYINQTSLRQLATPDQLLGRMNASYRFLTMGMIPLGSLMGGVLSETLGLHAALVVSGGGVLLPVAWLWFSPVRALCTSSPRSER